MNPCISASKNALYFSLFFLWFDFFSHFRHFSQYNNLIAISCKRRGVKVKVCRIQKNKSAHCYLYYSHIQMIVFSFFPVF